MGTSFDSNQGIGCGLGSSSFSNKFPFLSVLCLEIAHDFLLDKVIIRVILSFLLLCILVDDLLVFERNSEFRHGDVNMLLFFWRPNERLGSFFAFLFFDVPALLIKGVRNLSDMAQLVFDAPRLILDDKLAFLYCSRCIESGEFL